MGDRTSTTLLTGEVTPAKPQIEPLISAQEFFITVPLYEQLVISPEQTAEAKNIRFNKQSFDSFCPWCGEHSIFHQSNIPRETYNIDWDSGSYFDCVYVCSRQNHHALRFVVKITKSGYMKIGQFPSLADLCMHDVQKYSKVLPKPYFKELTKAIGLAAHGVGIGSFVYLRRIFESLIENAHLAAKSDASWDEGAYNGARVDEKIQMLKDKLPAFLVEHKAIYGVLSKGVHELSEDECLKYFPAVKMGIEMILDDEIERLEKQKKMDAAKKALQGVITEVNK